MENLNNNILVVGKKGDRNIVPKKGPKPKKQPEPEPEPVNQYRPFYERPPPKYFYNGRMNYYPPPALRLIPYIPWRQAYNAPAKEEKKRDDEDEDEDEDEKPPRLNGKQKSLIKRLNKSPNSAFSKERTLCRSKDVAAKSNKLAVMA